MSDNQTSLSGVQSCCNTCNSTFPACKLLLILRTSPLFCLPSVSKTMRFPSLSEKRDIAVWSPFSILVSVSTRTELSSVNFTVSDTNCSTFASPPKATTPARSFDGSFLSSSLICCTISLRFPAKLCDTSTTKTVVVLSEIWDIDIPINAAVNPANNRIRHAIVDTLLNRFVEFVRRLYTIHSTHTNNNTIRISGLTSILLPYSLLTFSVVTVCFLPFCVMCTRFVHLDSFSGNVTAKYLVDLFVSVTVIWYRPAILVSVYTACPCAFWSVTVCPAGSCQRIAACLPLPSCRVTVSPGSYDAASKDIVCSACAKIPCTNTGNSICRGRSELCRSKPSTATTRSWSFPR